MERSDREAIFMISERNGIRAIEKVLYDIRRLHLANLYVADVNELEANIEYYLYTGKVE